MLPWILGALGLTGGGIGIAALLGGGPAMLLGAKWLWGWLSHATFLQVVCVLLCAAFAVDHAGLLMAHRHSEKVEGQLDRCTSARHADQLAYTQAQAQAQAKNRADVARDESRKQELSNETVSRLNADLAELRRRLSEGGTAAPQSHPVKPGVPQGDQPASGTPGEARVCLSPAELLRAAENEERHDRLIDYVEGLSKIDPNAH